MTLQPIICKNNAEDVLNNIQEYLENGSIIKSIYVVDTTDDQIVVLIGDEEVTRQMAEIFWVGYQAALG